MTSRLPRSNPEPDSWSQDEGVQVTIAAVSVARQITGIR